MAPTHRPSRDRGVPLFVEMGRQFTSFSVRAAPPNCSLSGLNRTYIPHLIVCLGFAANSGGDANATANPDEGALRCGRFVVLGKDMGYQCAAHPLIVGRAFN